MSDRSTKYLNIPSIAVLSAYKSGRLKKDDQLWVEELMDHNPMVAAVVADLNPADEGLVQSISSRIHDRVVSPRMPHRGFWTRYGGWIGLSSIVLLLGIYGLIELNKPAPRYFNDSLTIAEPTHSADAVVHLYSNNKEEGRRPAIEDQADVTIQAEENKKGDKKQAKDSFEEGINVAQNSSVSEENVERKSDQTDKTDQSKTESRGVEKKSGTDNTRTFSDDKSTEQITMLALNNVQILSKTNPDAMKTRSTGGKGNPLGEQTTSSSQSFSVSDIPAYPGGDRALQNYFKGALRPIEIPKEQDQFDHSVLLELTVNARGKLKDYKIRGQLHPSHQKALVEAIENLPRFRKGSEKITYSLGLSF